jgi:glucose-1-phosphate thymidylyltransferase
MLSLMRGIVLAAGTGSRLWPLTRGLSKQLLPVYDKPLIYYPIATLMLANIREILLIVNRRDLPIFQQILGGGESLGIEISYEIQESPRGLADAFIIGEHFINNESSALILGDNLFYGQGLGVQLREFNKIIGAQIFGYRVKDPERYGVIEFDSSGKVISIEEKPAHPKSDYAIPGLYFFDSAVVEIAKNVKPSSRGELEITSVLNAYAENDSLHTTILERGTAWLDTGTFESLHAASSFIQIIEERQGFKVACLEEIAWRQGWINDRQLANLANEYQTSEYSQYLRALLA